MDLFLTCLSRQGPAGRWFLPFVIVAGLCAGCFQPSPPSEDQLERGCVFMLPGVESGAWQFRDTIAGMREAGLARAVRVIEWGARPFGSLPNLIDERKNRQRATTIAFDIAKYREAYPNGSVTVVGYSGGGGLAVWVAESLPESDRLDRLILIAPALSPGYDLSKALGRCEKGIVCFYSSHDWWTLGVGTSLFGTMDRTKGDAAGYVRFRGAGLEGARSARVTQIGWEQAWAKLGHHGGHTGWLAKAWAREVLAPIIDPSMGRSALPATDLSAP